MDHESQPKRTNATSVEDLTNRVEELEQELQSAQAENEYLKRISHTDWLTGIANRRQFEKDLAGRMAEFERLGNSFCLVIVDPDSFKALNDRSGHLAGDRWLKLLATSLSENLRICDSVYRIGGDEFAAIMPGTNCHQAEAAFDRIAKTVLPLINREFADCEIGLSIGIAEPETGQSADELIDSADQAMYAAKRNTATH